MRRAPRARRAAASKVARSGTSTEELGLDLDRFNTARDEGRRDRTIDEDLALARRLGTSSKPTSYVNGRVVQGAQPEDCFAVAIDDALDLAAAELERYRDPPPLDLSGKTRHRSISQARIDTPQGSTYVPTPFFPRGSPHGQSFGAQQAAHG